LDEYIESGILVDAKVSPELLFTIFNKCSPLHDGAVIIEGGRVVAAGCLLPLTESRLVDSRLGTRHRAALGLTEQTDAVVLVVSEETGIISLSENGRLTRYLNKQTLEKELLKLYQTESKSGKITLENFFQKKRGDQ
jgi:diadenylate cyclase